MELLLDTLKWSGAVGAAALVLTALKPALDRRYSARWRYWAWLAMAVLLLLAPIQWEKLAPRTSALSPAEPPVVIQVPRMELAVSREEGLALRRSAPAPGGAPVRRAALETVLPRLWLAGAAAWGLWRLLGTALFLRRARRWSRSPSEDTARIYAGLCRELAVKRPPVLRVSAAAGSPLLAGLMRPRLFLPGEDWGERELRFILRHELTHYRRRDLWYKLILLGAGSLHWFNPLVHLLVREAEADLELTCDDLVMAGADLSDRQAYSETLLASIRRQKGLLSRSSLSTHFYGGAGVMRERFRNILGTRGRRWGAAALALALTVTVAAACSFGLRQEEPPQETDASAGGAPPAENAPDARTPEVWAQGIMDRDGESLAREQGVTVTGQALDYLTSQGSWTVDGTAYSAWRLGYRLEIDGGEPVVREGWGILGQESDGDSGGMWHEGEPGPWAVETAGYTWEEYVVCYSYGMRLSDAEGWPLRTEEFVSAYLDGHNTWAAGPQDVALEYLSQAFDLAAEGGVRTLYTFENGTSLLLEAVCEDQPVRLLVRQAAVQGSEAPIWQIRGVAWSGDALLYADRAELGRGVAGRIELCGRRPEYGGRWKIGRIVWTPAGGAPREYSVKEAVDLTHPGWNPENAAIYTESWNPDGGLILEDVNFDGYLDIGLQAAVTAYNLPYFYWTYNPDTGGFDFAFWLVGPMTVDSENRQLVCETHSGPTYYTEYYAYDHAGRLYLARRDTQDLSLDSGPVYTEYFDRAANDWRGGSYAELTAEELASFARYFNSFARNGLLRFPYARESYRDLAKYLPILFYDHDGSFADMTEAEREILGPMELDGRKLTADYMADCLFDGYLLSREEAEQVIADAGDSLGRYLPEYDAYYSQRGDTEMQDYVFDSGLRFSDGSATLYYTAGIWTMVNGEPALQPDQYMCVNLGRLEDGWYVERNYVNE